MISFSGALFSTKWLIFSLMSKMITIPMIRISAMKKVSMNFLMMYLSIFFSGLSIPYNLVLIFFTASSFQAAKSPASMWMRAFRTRSR